MVKILVAEDDSALREFVCASLAGAGYESVPCSDGESAFLRLSEEPFDMLISDIMMPGMDGFRLAERVRAKDKNLPILFMTALEDKPSQERGYRLGIDDYVVKPFSPKEVMARINRLVKRNKQSNEVLKFKGLEIDMAGRNVYVDGKKVVLTPKEYELLFYFVKNKNIAISREKLLTDVWGFDFYGDDRTVDTHIKMLRSNLGSYRDFIVTLRGLGYKFEV